MEEKIEYFRSKYSYKTRLNKLKSHNRKIIFEGNLIDKDPVSPKLKQGYTKVIIFI